MHFLFSMGGMLGNVEACNQPATVPSSGAHHDSAEKALIALLFLFKASI
jgi:hypothetical protein